MAPATNIKSQMEHNLELSRQWTRQAMANTLHTSPTRTRQSPPSMDSSYYNSSERAVQQEYSKRALRDHASRDAPDLDGREPVLVVSGLPRKLSDQDFRRMFALAKDFVSAQMLPEKGTYDTRSAIARFSTYQGGLEAQSSITNRAHEIFEDCVLQPTLYLLDSDSPLHSSRQAEPRYRPSIASNSNSSSSSSINGNYGSQRYGHGSSQDISPRKLYQNYNVSPDGQERALTSAFGDDYNFVRGSSDAFSQNYGSIDTHRPSLSLGRSSGQTLLRETQGELNEEYDSILHAERSRYLYGDESSPQNREDIPRRATIDSRFSNLSLETNFAFSNGRNRHELSAPLLDTVAISGSSHLVPSPSSGSLSAAQNGSSYLGYPRVLPPANPADQNPPCNTLYVGNLPMNTSEDELKALFSRQRGYKRLCFRTKANGPMCFVEFEDVAYATRALTELYGRGLSNSIKGGIRLSFSKNPLGVRSGHPSHAASFSNGGSVNGRGAGEGYHTATHAPPGIPHPSNSVHTPRQLSYDMSSPNSGSNGSPPSATPSTGPTAFSRRNSNAPVYVSTQSPYPPGLPSNLYDPREQRQQRQYSQQDLDLHHYESPNYTPSAIPGYYMGR